MNLNAYFKEQKQGESILIYGAGGSRKTWLAATLAKKYNLYWFDLENGVKTLRTLPKEDLERIKYFRLPDLKQYPIAAETIGKIFNGGVCKICSAHGKVNCTNEGCKAEGGSEEISLSKLTHNDVLVIDSATQLGLSYLNSIILKLQGRGKPTEDYDAVQPEWNDYRYQGNLLTSFLTAIQQLTNTNRVVICHAEEYKEKGSTQARVIPVMGTDNYSKSDLTKFFDHVVYTSIQNGKFKAVSGSLAASLGVISAPAKSRSGVEIEKTPAGQEYSLLPFFT